MVFNVHEDSINDLLFDDVTITCACQDGGVKVLDFNLGDNTGLQSGRKHSVYT